MKIFILEYFTSRTKDPEEKLSFYNEGLKMLNTVLCSAADIASVEITTLIHQDFYNKLFYFLKQNYHGYPSPNINFIKRNSNPDKKENYFRYLKQLQLKDFDYFLIIAPESDNIAADITEIFEEKEISNLGSSSKVIKKAADKWLFYKKFSHCLNMPKTKLIKTKTNSFLDDEIFPAVIKARYSAGSELKIVKNKNEFLNHYKEVLKHEINKRDYIIQKIIPGEAGSISVVSKDQRYFILSINKQIINKENFSYQGGIINYSFKNTCLLKNSVKQIKENYPDLNGYFGIDFIYHNGKYYFLEINPRLTSSIIGISELYNFFELIILVQKMNKRYDLNTFDKLRNEKHQFLLD